MRRRRRRRRRGGEEEEEEVTYGHAYTDVSWAIYGWILGSIHIRMYLGRTYAYIRHIYGWISYQLVVLVRHGPQ